jgi:glycosyltransferase involved in cell wall biosynthesis
MCLPWNNARSEYPRDQKATNRAGLLTEMSDVSIIIPTHNRPHLLPRAVASARAAGADVEIIVVDDASRDETAAVCRQLEGIKYLRLEHNQGVAGARNVGILASSSDFIAFLDDDDLRLPGTLDLQTAVLTANPEAGFVCGGMLIADQNYELTGETSVPAQLSGDVFWQLLELEFPVMPLGVVIRKSCFRRVGLLKRRLCGIDDWDILVRLAELYPVVIMEQPVGIYRSPTPGSGQGSSAQAAQLYDAVCHQLQLFCLPRVKSLPPSRRKELRRRTINRVADTLLLNAWRRLPERDFAYVATNILTALRLNPMRILRPAVFRRMAGGLTARDQTGPIARGQTGDHASIV